MRADDGRWVSAVELDRAGVPAEAHDVIKRRLAILSDRLRDLLEVASVMGLEFEEHVVRGVLRIDADESVAALDEGIQAGLVREIGVGRYAFIHALVRQAVLDDQSQTGRARWHWLLAEELDRSATERVGEIAHHYVAGADFGNPRTVMRAALAAAESAMAGAAFEEAADLARAALSAVNRTPSDLTARFIVLQTLGTCLNAIPDVDGAAAVWLEAADIARQLRDPDRLFATVTGYGYLLRPDGDRHLVRLLDDVLTLVGPADSQLRACALGWRGVPSFPGRGSRSPEGDWDMVQEAVAMASRTGDDAAIVMTLRSRLLLEGYSPDAIGMLPRRLRDRSPRSSGQQRGTRQRRRSSRSWHRAYSGGSGGRRASSARRRRA